MRLVRFAVAAGLLAPLAPCLSNAQALERPKQYIMMSFDGSYRNEMWQATRDFGVANNARFTHFISGVDFLVGSSARALPGETKKIYAPPRFSGREKDRSDVGFGGPREMVADRVREVIASINAGMEIGGHANGHVHGGAKWTEQEWSSEFDFFHRFIFDVISINKIEPLLPDVKKEDWFKLQQTQHVGFRAPYLETSAGMFAAMGKPSWQVNGQEKAPYRYDASQTSGDLSKWPTKMPNGIWNFPLVTIPVPQFPKRVLSMDYNFYASISRDREQPQRSHEFEEQMYQAYVNWFKRNYFGNRAPLNIGHHFSTWNKAAYWRALQRFVKTVCSLPEVGCVTYAQMVSLLDGGMAGNLKQYQANNFNQDGRPQVEIPVVSQIAMGTSTTLMNFVENGKTAFLADSLKSRYFWEVNGERLQESRVDLEPLARQGITDLVLVDAKSGEKLKLFIHWDPTSGLTELHRLEDADVKGCDAKAHEENVEPSLLGEGETKSWDI